MNDAEGNPLFARSGARAIPSVELYRRLLAEQPDSSVTVISVGFYTNLAQLLASQPDSVSPLSGRDPTPIPPTSTPRSMSAPSPSTISAVAPAPGSSSIASAPKRPAIPATTTPASPATNMAASPPSPTSPSISPPPPSRPMSSPRPAAMPSGPTPSAAPPSPTPPKLSPPGMFSDHASSRDNPPFPLSSSLCTVLRTQSSVLSLLSEKSRGGRAACCGPASRSFFSISRPHIGARMCGLIQRVWSSCHSRIQLRRQVPPRCGEAGCT